MPQRKTCKHGRLKNGYCKKSAVSIKIGKLMKEGYPRNQAIAIAINMKQNNQLGPRGGYIKRRKSKTIKPRYRMQMSGAQKRKRSRIRSNAATKIQSLQRKNIAPATPLKERNLRPMSWVTQFLTAPVSTPRIPSCHCRPSSKRQSSKVMFWKL